MSRDITAEIIDRIRRNRISTSEIGDCLNKTGALPGVRALNPGHFRVGRVFWVYAYNESNWELHEQLREAPEGHVIVAEGLCCGTRALFGALVSKYVMLYRQATAIVALGYLRDIPHLIKENWPVWLTGTTPIGCFNVRNPAPPAPEWLAARRAQYDGAVAVCDDSGVMIVPQSVQDQGFLDKLNWIEELEDAWFDCIDRHKLSTYDAVCLKKYQQHVASGT